MNTASPELAKQAQNILRSEQRATKSALDQRPDSRLQNREFKDGEERLRAIRHVMAHRTIYQPLAKKWREG